MRVRGTRQVITYDSGLPKYRARSRLSPFRSSSPAAAPRGSAEVYTLSIGMHRYSRLRRVFSTRASPWRSAGGNTQPTTVPLMTRWLATHRATNGTVARAMARLDLLISAQHCPSLVSSTSLEPDGRVGIAEMKNELRCQP